MRSDLPKVLHPLAGKPLLAHVLDTARKLKPGRLIVVDGHGGELVRKKLADAGQADDLIFVRQAPQLGTGHAVQQTVAYLDESQPTLVLYGDVPLTTEITLQRLVEAAAQNSLAILTVNLNDPTGYGRIVRNAANGIERIVEQKDATANERAIHEVNTGILIAPTVALKRWLNNLSNNNAQGEYYLTDIVAQSVSDGVPVTSAQPDHEWETLGVNSQSQLAQLERQHQLTQAEALLEAGVTLADPARIDIRGTLNCGRDVSIDVGCVFEGKVTIADQVRIGPHCVLRNVKVGTGTIIEAFSHLDDATVGADNRIGPYARLRPGAVLAEGVHIGNFVEVKNSQIAAQSKANHLSYIGDTTMGARVNVGAGTITCNYDGVNKHRTVIEDDVFIGSDTQLVAPVTVKRGATLGAGTTLTQDAPQDQLTISRAKQLSLPNWKRPIKK